MMTPEHIKKILQGFSERKLLVMGDLMIDEYIWGKVDRISPEAPVQVVEVRKQAYTLGGAGNVANNLISLGARVEVASVVGDDADSALLREEMLQLGVGVEGIFHDSSRMTCRKTRVIAINQQILRLDRESKEPISPQLEERLITHVTQRLENAEALLISDYLKGVLTERVLQRVIRKARRRNIPVVVDPKGMNYSKYRGAAIITPNKKEASLAAGLQLDGDANVEKAAKKLLQELDLGAVLITRSKEGMTLLERGKPICNIPAKAREVYDVSGAGDTVMAVLGLGLAQGLAFCEAAALANTAAGIVVSKIGTATLTREEIIDYSLGEHHYSDNKIKSPKEAKRLLTQEKLKGKKLVLTLGCFDRLQVGQIKFLQKARGRGDVLAVGLWDDATALKLKRSQAASISESERAHIISALDCVTYVITLNEGSLKELLEGVRPQSVILPEGGYFEPNLIKAGLTGEIITLDID